MANKNKPLHDREKDQLRGEFTNWLNTTLIRARADFFDLPEQQQNELSLEAIPVDLIPDPVDRFSAVERSSTDFEFEEARLAQAFAELPLMRREVLRLLFVEMRDPTEISEILHCSVNYVHLQKSRALKRLREQLTKHGVDDYE